MALDQRRRLEAQRLAAAGRQHDNRVAAVEDRRHRFALQRAEGGVTPVFGEGLFEGDHGRWRSPWLPRRRIRDEGNGGDEGNGTTFAHGDSETRSTVVIYPGPAD